MRLPLSAGGSRHHRPEGCSTGHFKWSSGQQKGQRQWQQCCDGDGGSDGLMHHHWQTWPWPRCHASHLMRHHWRTWPWACCHASHPKQLLSLPSQPQLKETSHRMAPWTPYVPTPPFAATTRGQSSPSSCRCAKEASLIVSATAAACCCCCCCCPLFSKRPSPALPLALTSAPLFHPQNSPRNCRHQSCVACTGPPASCACAACRSAPCGTGQPTWTRPAN